MKNLLHLLVCGLVTVMAGCASSRESDQPGPVTHAFLATGAETRLVSNDGQVVWTHSLPSRDGWVLDNGNVLIAVSKCAAFPHGGVAEITHREQVVFKWQGTQEEVNTVQPLDRNRLLVTEAGPKPRILEIDRKGAILLEVPIQCQLTNFHMQTRMTRKLENGNYLVPHLLDKVVREYDRTGRIVWEAATPNWAFTAIRLPNGNTLVGCTYGNEIVELNRKGEVVWRVSNEDLPSRMIKDACGVQRLPNGNTVFTSYGSKAGDKRLIEITPDKQVVWTYSDQRPAGIHHFQILETNGRKLKGQPLR